MKIQFLASAEHELAHAIEFYENQMPGLGQLFYHEVNDAMDLIRLYPEGWQSITKLTRKCCLRKFPYMILYGIVKNIIVVSAVAHQHQHPKTYIR